MPVSMSKQEFEGTARRALARLPGEYQLYLRGLELRIEDYPDDELMEEMGASPPHYPFGVYDGVPLTEYDGPRSDFPGTLTLFKRPLEQWCRTREELAEQIERTVWHEIGHRFGFEEDEMPDWIESSSPGAGREEGRREAARHLEQARSDLRAAGRLAEAGCPDWAFEAAREGARRALQAVLLGRGLSDVVVSGMDTGLLFARAAAGLPELKPFAQAADWERVETGMGEPGSLPPARRFTPKRLREALETARGILAAAGKGVEDGSR